MDTPQLIFPRSGASLRPTPAASFSFRRCLMEACLSERRCVSRGGATETAPGVVRGPGQVCAVGVSGDSLRPLGLCVNQEGTAGRQRLSDCSGLPVTGVHSRVCEMGVVAAMAQQSGRVWGERGGGAS